MPPVIGSCAFWQINEIVRMRLSYKAGRFAFLVFFIALIFLIDFGFDIEELISGISTCSLSWPTLF